MKQNKYNFSDLLKNYPKREYIVLQHGFTCYRKTALNISINSLNYVNKEFGVNFWIEVLP